jgi:endoglucanase
MAQRDSAYYGVSLSGAEWASGEMYPSTDLLDYYSTKGIILIRLPIMWERLQPGQGGELDINELSKLLSFIDAVAARNMKMIVDVHNYGRYNGYVIGNGVSINDVSDMWTKLATQLKSKTCIYGYGIMNEPHDMLNSPSWKDIAQAIITGIRTVDQSTTIIVGGDSWSSAERWPAYSDNLKTLVDPNSNLMFEAHCYFDSDASGQYVQTYDSSGIATNVYDAEKITTATGVNRVKPFVQWLQTNNLKGFIGEYGVPADDVRWLDVLDTFMVYLKANHIGGAYWDCANLNCDPYSGNYDSEQMSVLEKFGTVIPTIAGNPGNTGNPADSADNDNNISISIYYPTLTASGKSHSLGWIDSYYEWSTVSDQSWLTVSPILDPVKKYGTNYEYDDSIIISATENTGLARSAKVTISFQARYSTEIKTVTVTQEAADVINVSSLTDETVSVYPNPATTHFFVTSDAEATVEVFTGTGTMILQTKVLGTASIPLKDVASGLYFVKVMTERGVVTKQLMVE